MQKSAGVEAARDVPQPARRRSFRRCRKSTQRRNAMFGRVSGEFPASRCGKSSPGTGLRHAERVQVSRILHAAQEIRERGDQGGVDVGQSGTAVRAGHRLPDAQQDATGETPEAPFVGQGQRRR